MSRDGFAAAQQRILARQAARRADAEAIQRADAIEAAQLPLARLPYPLNRSTVPILSLWNSLVASEGTKPAFRVGQVDAELLDEELLTLLRGQTGEALQYFGSHLQQDWSHEISLLLRAILFKLSIWDHDASYGASLQNLRLSDARQGKKEVSKPSILQKSLYGLITVFGRYGWDRWEDWLVEQEGGYTVPTATITTLSRLTSHLSTIHSLAAFGSFIVFLVNGRYRTLTDRLLRLRLVSPVSHVSREVSFEYLNRQLVWHAFTEFLLFLLPLVGISRWRRWLSRAWKRTKAAVRLTEHGEEEVHDTKQGPLAYLPERTCAICYSEQSPSSTSETEVLGANIGAGGGLIGSASTDVVNPYETIPCKCIYCFVCIASKIEAEEGSGWSCLRCGQIVFKCKPWSGDIFEQQGHTSTHLTGHVIKESEQSEDETSQHNETIHTSLDLPSDLGSSQWTLEDRQGSDQS